MEKRLLQIAVALFGLAPVAGGVAGALWGPVILGQMGDAVLDSQYRYMSGLELAIGLSFWTAIPHIERQGQRFALLTLIVVAGGFCRGLGMLVTGLPGPAMSLALVVELVVTPLLYLWRERVGRIAAVDAIGAEG